MRGLTKHLLWMSGITLLAAGGMIYVLFRPDGILLVNILRHSPLHSGVDALRTAAADMPVSAFVTGSLPGALWSAAYVLTMAALWVGRPLSQRLAMTAVMPFIGVGSELLQAFRLLPGTPDATDAFCYVMPYLLYLTLQLWQTISYRFLFTQHPSTL